MDTQQVKEYWENLPNCEKIRVILRLEEFSEFEGISISYTCTSYPLPVGHDGIIMYSKVYSDIKTDPFDKFLEVLTWWLSTKEGQVYERSTKI